VAGSVEERDRDGRTPLHFAAFQGDVDRVLELIASGADLDAADAEGRTPLHYAAQEWWIDAAAQLCEAGATVDCADAFGNTPLGRATFESRGRGEMILLLIGHGADPDRPNHSGVTPRQLATTIANYDVRQFFGAP
jgi:uncharacterized protein